MHFSFSAVDENVDENEIHFRPKKKKTKVTYGYITEPSYGSVANGTFSAQRKMTFLERKRKIKRY